MKTITIELPVTHVLNRSGVEFTANVGDMSPEIIAELVLHGLTQKIGDAAAGAKGNADEARGCMAKVHDALLAGNWGAKREGGGRVADPVKRAAMAIAGLRLDGRPDKKTVIAAVAAKYDVNPAKARAMVIAKLAERDDIMTEARAQVAAQTGLDVGLDDLGL